MLKNKISHLLLCSIAVITLGACETLEKVTYDPFQPENKEIQVNDSVSINPLSDSDQMSTMPNMGGNINADMGTIDPSVEIFDMELNPDYRRGVSDGVAGGGMMRTQPAPMNNLNYSDEYQTADSSVTIYGLDGMPPLGYAGSTGGSSSYGSPYGSSNMASYGSVAGQIFFKHGSSRLGSGDLRKIDSLAEQSKFAPVNHVTVAGYASKPTQAGSDTTQAHIINLRQSMKRSENVTKALIKQGLPGDKIKTVSWGASKATGNDTQDRRVDVVMGEQ